MNAVKLIPNMRTASANSRSSGAVCVADDQAAEGHGVGGEKEPHSKFAQFSGSGEILGAQLPRVLQQLHSSSTLLRVQSQMT